MKPEYILLSNPELRSTFDCLVHKIQAGKDEYRHNALFTDSYECVYERTDRTLKASKNDHPNLKGGEKLTVFRFTGIEQKMTGKVKRGKFGRVAA